MDIILLRHPALRAPEGMCFGRTDFPLAAGWRLYTQQWRRALQPLYLQEAYASEQRRSMEFAEQLGLGRELRVDERLNELDFGDWEGKRWNDLDQETLNAWMQDYARQQVPGGESYAQLSKRVRAWLSEVEEAKLQSAIVISHKGPILALLAAASGLQLSKSFNFEIKPGRAIWLRYEQERWTVLGVNLGPQDIKGLNTGFALSQTEYVV